MRNFTWMVYFRVRADFRAVQWKPSKKKVKVKKNPKQNCVSTNNWTETGKKKKTAENAGSDGAPLQRLQLTAAAAAPVLSS